MSTGYAHYDGQHNVAFTHGPLIVTWDREHYCNFYKQTYRVQQAYFKKLAIGSRVAVYGYPNSGYLYEETEPQIIGGDILEWERLFCDVPPQRVEPETIAYCRQYPILSGGSSMVELQRTEACRTVYSYTYEPTGVAPLPKITGRYVKFADGIIYLTNPLYAPTDADNAGGGVLAEISTVTRFKGYIFEDCAKYVPKFGLPVQVTTIPWL